MIHCSVSPCKNFCSEIFSTKSQRSRWLILRSCRCGSYRSTLQDPIVCSCANDGPFPVQYWPNLDWFAFGGIDELALCPDCKKLVYDEILKQRELDPSMNAQGQQNRGNVH